jgi:hypothetical protein
VFQLTGAWQRFAFAQHLASFKKSSHLAAIGNILSSFSALPNPDILQEIFTQDRDQ